MLNRNVFNSLVNDVTKDALRVEFDKGMSVITSFVMKRGKYQVKYYTVSSTSNDVESEEVNKGLEAIADIKEDHIKVCALKPDSKIPITEPVMIASLYKQYHEFVAGCFKFYINLVIERVAEEHAKKKLEEIKGQIVVWYKDKVMKFAFIEDEMGDDIEKSSILYAGEVNLIIDHKKMELRGSVGDCHEEEEEEEEGKPSIFLVH